jgi:3-hydroxyisobutyrate dehydrogenase-like beta-hydroxyacid dehydrogenase
MDTIGFIGLGNLGLPIAGNLCKAGYPVKVYNRTQKKASPLIALGAQVVSKASEVADQGGIVVTLVSDDDALRHVADDDFARALGKDGLHSSMSTMAPKTSRDLALHHRQFGVRYVSAPVFARPDAAAARLGNVCLSGGMAVDRNRAKPVLSDGVAKQIFDFGDDAGSANVVKLIGNFMIASSIEMMAEGFVLAEKNGLAAQAVYDMLTSTIFAAPVFQNYGRIILKRQFEPASFRLALGLKDVNLVLQNGNQSQTPLPLAHLVRNRLLKAMEEGNSEVDWSSFSEQVRRDAGLT